MALKKVILKDGDEIETNVKTLIFLKNAIAFKLVDMVFRNMLLFPKIVNKRAGISKIKA